MAEDDKMQLHIAMFPWLAFGHLIPFLELSKLIAQKGHKISFVSTPRNIDRLPKLPPNLSPLIEFVKLPLPCVENLPHDAEATTDLPIHKVPYLKNAHDGLQQHLSCFLEKTKPDWVICDFAAYWLPPIASKFGIPLAFFSILWAASCCFLAGSTSSLINGDDPRRKPEDFTRPPEWIPFPSKVAYKLHEAKKVFEYLEVNDSGVSDIFRLGSSIAGSDVVLVRSCLEIERDYLSLFAKNVRKSVVPVGLLPPSLGGSEEVKEDTWITIENWLDQQSRGSVVYVAFGTEAILTQDELTELAMGLELSGLPFLWALRKGLDSLSLELPYGFQERTKAKGLVWTSWVPQVRILAHQSVGGFLTHTGWSSVIEGLSFGRPLIMFPMLTDQGLIARVFEDKMVGMEIPKNEEDGSFTRFSVVETLKLVLVDDKGQIYRDKALEMMKLFGDKELHDRYVDELVEYLKNHGRINRE